jgi:hypothetical protein
LQAEGMKPETPAVLQESATGLKKEVKEFFAHEMRVFFYNIGKEMDFSPEELDKNWSVIMEILKRMGADEINLFDDQPENGVKTIDSR